MEIEKPKVKIDQATKSKYNEKYYNRYKEKLLSNLKEKVYCACCKCYCSRVNMKKHERTTKHINYQKISNIKTEE